MKWRTVVPFVILAIAIPVIVWWPKHAPAAAQPAGTVGVELGREVFFLEPATDDATRDRGLGGRRSIAANGGMLFVFPELATREFVMRDCVVPLDLLYMDEDGRIVSLHEMVPEPPRTEEERADDSMGDFNYNARLTGYASGEAVRLAIELRGGTCKRLGVKVGDRVRFVENDKAPPGK